MLITLYQNIEVHMVNTYEKYTIKKNGFGDICLFQTVGEYEVFMCKIKITHK